MVWHTCPAIGGLPGHGHQPVQPDGLRRRSPSYRRRLERRRTARNAEEDAAAEHVQEVAAEEANRGTAETPVVTNAVEAEDNAERPVDAVEAELV